MAIFKSFTGGRTGLPSTEGLRQNSFRFAGGQYASAHFLQWPMWRLPFQFACSVKPWLQTSSELTTRRERQSAFRLSLARSLAFFVQKDFLLQRSEERRVGK